MKGEKYHVLFHVPHDGNEMPKELMKSICISPSEFMQYHNAMRDTLVRELIPSRQDALVFPYSRLFCDVEKPGMDEKAYDGKRINVESEVLRQKTLRCYQSHHATLDAYCRYAKLLLIDLHSFSGDAISAEQKEGYLCDDDLPEICIGVDAEYTPSRLWEKVSKTFAKRGYIVSVNMPFCGCMVPAAVLRGESNCEVASIKIEGNKRIYLRKNRFGEYYTIPRIREEMKKCMEEILLFAEGESRV